MKEIELNVNGRVQGIRFRRVVESFANKHGIRGYVRNREDGSVFIIAQGEEETLRKLLTWIQSNPGLSNISSLSYNLKAISKHYDDFTVLKDRAYLVDKVKSVIHLGKSFMKKGDKIPEHVVIIPDGNRRWAKERGLNPASGHYKSSEYQRIMSLFYEARNLGIKYLSVWGFSTENWSRSREEVNAIFSLLTDLVDRLIKDAHKNKIKFRHIGKKDRIPKLLMSKLMNLEKVTANYKDFHVQLLLDYGGRDEIVRSVNKIIASGKKKITEEEIGMALDTKGIPDPDLIIRTSGEKRLSGAMPFQAVYAELYFADVMFPDFDAEELRRAVKEYSSRKRRYGGS